MTNPTPNVTANDDAARAAGEREIGMSDRTPSSVRSGSRTGDAAAPTDNAPVESAPVTSTQSIPTTGSQRAQSAAAGTTSAAGSPGQPAGTPASAPPVPPATGAGATVPPAMDTSAAPTGSSAAAAAADTGAPSRVRGRGPAKSRGPRRARLQLRHIDTWSALKISLVLSIALFFIWMVAVGVLYGVLSALGVFDTLNDLFGQLGSASGSARGGDVVTPGVVFGGAAVIGAINIVLMTALCTVGTFIYNLCSDLVGGLELTLSERD
ncbi:MAG: hypothetical protein JWP62_2083 [Blastococcus sp.]|nr:hypothetical protein [Blastococcus sp.]